jgi:ABC-type lipoprotein release transport system permease subunit
MVIAWRNIWRHPRRTLLTITTMALGLMLLLVSIGLGDGGHYQMIESAVKLGSGHVVIQQEGYQQSRGMDRFLNTEDQSAALDWLKNVGQQFEIQAAVKRILASGLAASAEDSAGVLIIGIQPELEKKASRFSEKLVLGQFPENADSNRVVLGEGISRKLAIGIGDKLVLTAQEVLGSELQSLLVHVGGVLRTGVQDIDESTVLVPLRTAQRFLKMDDHVHQIAIISRSSRRSEELATLGKSRFQELEVLSWAEALPEMSDFIKVDDAGNYLFNMIFFVLIAFLILNTLMMSVLERKREFALLDALGLPPDRRFTMVMIEAGVLAFLASAAGTLLGLLGHFYFAIYGLPMNLFYSGEVTAAGVTFDPVIYSNLSMNRILGCFFLVLLLTLLLALFPARHAARAGDAHLLGRI